VAVFPQLVRSSGFVLSESTFTFFDLTALCFALASLEKRNPMFGFAAGVVWGIASLTRANGILSLLFVGIFILLARRKQLLSAVQQTLLPIATGWLLVYGPFVLYLSQDYGKLTITPKASASAISIRGTYIGQPEHANGSDLDEKEFQKNQQHYPEGMVSYYLHYPKTALRVTIHNLRRSHFDDTLRDYDFPILLTAFVSIGLLITLQTGGWSLFHGVALLWIVGFYFFNAAFLIMLRRFYETSYILLAILGGAGLIGTFSLLRQRSKSAAIGLLLATYSISFVPILPDTKGFSLAPGINNSIPPYTGPSASTLRLISASNQVQKALNFGVSTCMALSGFPKSTDEASAWIESIQNLKPDFISCSSEHEKARFGCNDITQKLQMIPAAGSTKENEVLQFVWR
jgi:4-amino-4-deoxy-L-arabinose transferase-like glycosyltransferase